MRTMIWILGLWGFFAIASFAEAGNQPVKQTTKQAVKQADDHWRYAYHNDEWWYWLPTNRWAYWRNNRWNAYDPKTYVSPRALARLAALTAAAATATADGGYSSDSQVADDDSDIGPFYGRTVGGYDGRATRTNSEIGPFYGNALPSDIFGPRPKYSADPVYGHAIPQPRD